MKTFRILFTALAFLTFFSSCSDDFGLEYQVIGPVELDVEAGQSLDIIVNFESEVGLQQVILESDQLDLGFLENFTSAPSSVRRTVSVVIPSDATEGDIFDIRVEFSDTAGNSVVDNFSIGVE